MQQQPSKKIIRITTVPMALYYLLPGQMNFMQQNGYNVIMISADGKERLELMQQENCDHLIVPMTRKITPWQDLKSLWQLIKIMRRLQPDIVHSHTPKAGLLGMLAARFTGVKIRIHTVAGLPLMVEKGFKLLVLKWVEKITYAAANHVWPNSFSLNQFILEQQLTSPHKLKVIFRGSSNGINLNRFSTQVLDPTILQKIKDQIAFDNNKIYLLCIGRMVSDKGIPELVNVFKTLQHHHPALRLVLVGQFEKDLDPLPEATTTEIMLNPAITHINWSDHVEYYMAICQYFIFPSHREGFPNVLLQAGAMQLPIVCSRIAGNIDIVTHGETGIIFECNNEISLQQAIQQALNHPAGSRQMADNLLQIITSNYKREMIWKEILAQYDQLTGMNR